MWKITDCEYVSAPDFEVNEMGVIRHRVTKEVKVPFPRRSSTDGRASRQWSVTFPGHNRGGRGGQSFRVASIVQYVFRGSPPLYWSEGCQKWLPKEVSHKNDDDSDNRLANLIWETRSENMARRRPERIAKALRQAAATRRRRQERYWAAAPE
jgi:hypothetical protein